MGNITAKLAEAYAQVNENQKMANAKALAKATASSEKGKAAVTLPKAPWDKKKDESLDYNPAKGEYNQPKGKEVGKRVGTREAMDPVNHKALKGKHKDRDDTDIDNDGDTDSSDEYLHKRRKAISKNVKDEVEMNPKKTKDRSSTQNADTMESTVPSVYARILEARAMHYKGAAPAQDKEDGMAPMTKKTKKDMEAGMKVDDTDEKGHDDASKAGRAGPKAKARSGDNMKGDKSVINPVKK
jgi:hypothetical protein